jgi:hypothetical protein
MKKKEDRVERAANGRGRGGKKRKKERKKKKGSWPTGESNPRA